jgi:putative acetyltransferase
MLHAMRVVDFEPRHAEAWKRLGEAWISRHFTVEDSDRKILDDPQGQVLAGGGRIYIIEDDHGEAVGCAGLIALPPERGGGFEVSKMTVSDAARGRGLGRVLMQACIEGATAAGARRLYLETNDTLAPALGLYRAMGFADLPPQATPYARCNVWMERPLP